MENKELEKVYKFLKEINKFKNVYRLSLIAKDGRRESDAEHTWHLVMMVWCYSSFYESNLDLLKAIKMALVHDLVEIYSGDVYGGAFEEARKGKEAREKASAAKLFSLLPDELKKDFTDLWYEYEAKGTNEAKFVWALDKISPRFQLTLTERDKASDLPTDYEKISAQDKKISDISSSLKQVLEKIREERNR